MELLRLNINDLSFVCGGADESKSDGPVAASDSLVIEEIASENSAATVTSSSDVTNTEENKQLVGEGYYTVSCTSCNWTEQCHNGSHPYDKCPSCGSELKY